jgi:hypothetical protein
MSRTHPSIERSVRRAFELLIQIRGHRQASRLLELANSYMRMLIHGDQDCVPVVVSIRAVRIRERQDD